MTLQELDEVLRVWKTRLASIAENLLELQSESAYQSLTGTGGLEKAQITGLTASRVKPALGAMNTVFEQFGLLQATVDQAEALRKQLPVFFGGEAKARELEHLLFGKSIQLPAVEIPMEQRTLLGGVRSAEGVTLEELLNPMERAFTVARDAVLSADRAWTEFARHSGKLEEELLRLRGQRALPSALLCAALDSAENRLASVREHVRTDPLGAEGELRAQVEPALAEVSRRIEAALQLTAQLRVARARFEELKREHENARAAQEQAAKAGLGSAGAPLPAPCVQIQGLLEWLTRLEHKREEGAVEAVTIGLRHWNAAATLCVEQDRKAYEAAQTRMDQRTELRGRFDALKAKARRLGMAENNALMVLGTRVEGLLYGQPTDLEHAAAAVAQFEEFLSGHRGQAQLR